MKKFLFVSLFLTGMLVNAQEVDVDVDVDNGANVWELKANAFYLVLGAAEITIERSLNSESAIGISGFLPFDEDVKDDIEYYVAPYYRMYFGDKYAAGFFLEGFAMLNSTEREFFFEEESDNFVTDLALGIGLGGKWVTRRGFVGELSFGVGRNLFNTEESDIKAVAKGAISVGYRF